MSGIQWRCWACGGAGEGRLPAQHVRHMEDGVRGIADSIEEEWLGDDLREAVARLESARKCREATVESRNRVAREGVNDAER